MKETYKKMSNTYFSTPRGRKKRIPSQKRCFLNWKLRRPLLFQNIFSVSLRASGEVLYVWNEAKRRKQGYIFSPKGSVLMLWAYNLHVVFVFSLTDQLQYHYILKFQHRHEHQHWNSVFNMIVMKRLQASWRTIDSNKKINICDQMYYITHIFLQKWIKTTKLFYNACSGINVLAKQWHHYF